MFGFVFNIPKDVLGLMKVLFYCQIDRQSKQNKSTVSENFFVQNFNKSYSEIQPFCRYIKGDTFMILSKVRTDI